MLGYDGIIVVVVEDHLEAVVAHLIVVVRLASDKLFRFDYLRIKIPH